VVSEFQLIERIRRSAAASQAKGSGAGVALGIGDDAAVLRPTPGRELVVTTDTLNAGIHFGSSAAPSDVGYKALAVNLSDLAAMGANPRWALLSLSLPEENPAWVDSFIDGFLELAENFGVALVGGDTCAGPLSVTIAALGEVLPEQALTRGGASPGDLVMVSGCLGDAALALSERNAGKTPGETQSRALDRPIPRVALGASLIGNATSCIDVSDGLLADLGHIAEASGCGADIMLAALPASEELARREARRRWTLQLAGGDDYELCFTVPPDRAERMATLSDRLGLALTEIGVMTKRSGVRCVEPGGGSFEPPTAGFEHFT
jgi:thiamine-monophosphate kinase